MYLVDTNILTVLVNQYMMHQLIIYKIINRVYLST
nr:MAG TPA: hypothetical protein [Caudoviricetes sp.]